MTVWHYPVRSEAAGKCFISYHQDSTGPRYNQLQNCHPSSQHFLLPEGWNISSDFLSIWSGEEGGDTNVNVSSLTWTQTFHMYLD